MSVGNIEPFRPLAKLFVDKPRDTAANMSRPVSLRADTAPFVLAVGVATNLSGLRGAVRVMQGPHITELAAVAGEAGEVTTAIRTMDIPGIT